MADTTGDDTLDAMLRGGLPAGRTCLLQGEPGAGKSRLAATVLRAGVAAGEQCLYVTTDESAAAAAASLPLPDDPALTVAALEPGGDDALLVRTADGEETVAPAPVDHLAGMAADRVVIDGAVGLSAAAADPTRTTRRVTEDLLDRLEALGATTLVTTTQETVGLARRAHTVISLTAEMVRGDRQRFLEIRKCRGVDHDTRRHPFVLTDEGARVQARERGDAGAYLPTDAPGLDRAFVDGGVTLFEYGAPASHWPMTTAAMARAIADGQQVIAFLDPGTAVQTVDTLLAERVGSLADLLAAGDLVLVDTVSTADAPVLANLPSEHVYLLDEAESMQSIIRELAAEYGTEDVLSVVDHTAVQHLLTADQSRRLFSWAQANVMTLEGTLSMVLAVDPEVDATGVGPYFRGVADQVLRTWQDEDAIQYLSVERSPGGPPGYTRVVEHVDGPPYVRLD